MNQADMIKQIADASGHTKKDVENILKATADVGHKVLKSGDDITLPGFGKFSVRQRAARDGRNPATGEAMKIVAKNVPHFSAAKALKDAVAAKR